MPHSDILFASKLAQRISLREQYHSPQANRIGVFSVKDNTPMPSVFFINILKPIEKFEFM